MIYFLESSIDIDLLDEVIILVRCSSFNCYAPLNLSQLDNEVLPYSKCKGLVWIFRLG